MFLKHLVSGVQVVCADFTICMFVWSNLKPMMGGPACLNPGLCVRWRYGIFVGCTSRHVDLENRLVILLDMALKARFHVNR